MMKYSILLFFLFAALTHTTAQDVSAIDKLLLDAAYSEAVKTINQQLGASQDAKSKALLENKKAEALMGSGNFVEAEKLLNQAFTHAEESQSSLLKAITQTNYGLLYMNQGRNDLAMEGLKTALNELDKSNQGSSLEAAKTLAYLGNLYRVTGQYTQAEEQLNMALALREKQLPPTHELLAATYNDLGIVYSSNDEDKALTFYEKALAIYEQLHGKSHPKIAIAYTNIGFIYRKMELFGDAINNLESALTIWESVYSQPHASKAFVLFSLGQTYQQMKDMKAARGYYERALKMYEESYGKKHPDNARVLNALGNLDVSENRFTDALQYYQRALQANVADFITDDVNLNPALRNYYDGNVLLYTLLYKAEAWEAQYFKKTLRFDELNNAIHILQKCDTLIDKLRQQINNESDKITLGAIATEVYADGVRIAASAAQVAWKKKTYREQAFYFAEKSKSAVLLESISDAQAKSFAGIPEELLNEEKNLKSAVALCAQKLAQKPSVEEERYLREASFNLNRSYEAFVKNLETKFPEYFNLKFNTTSPSIKQLQNRLDAKTALVSYFIDEKNNRIYIFQITHTSYHITEHGLPAGFDKYITGFRNSLVFNEMDTYIKASNKLSAILIPDRLSSSIDNLVIVPTGRLSTIPFETLLTHKPSSSPTYQSLPYLVNRYSIRYEFSAGLILQKPSQTRSITPSIFLCAPIDFENTDLQSLPGSESEVQDISKLFASKQLKAGVFTRAQADERLIKSGQLKDYAYLHFATHGIVDESHPELSRIYLQSVGAEDGDLFAGEIYNLELRANLVTLSACQTGLGKISKGEGVIGLSRALVYAGARNSIVSFWSVADESTARLMKDFYKLLLESPEASYSHTLRLAKLNLIKQEAYASPFYWAPFILIGF
jgi:CHAT domain-containing protein/uncharacterized protein HemY